MVLCRTLDERVWMLNRQGKAAIVASAQGHEAAQIGSVQALRVGHDFFYIYYRDLAVLVSLGLTPAEIMLGFTAKAGEPLAGARQFPTHGASPKHGLVNLSNVVGTQIPQAVGSALASKMRGEDAVTIVYFGDGASSVGDCHEAMNFASVQKLPVVFIIENNKYAISVPLHRQMNTTKISDRAIGYGMPGVTVDGTDVIDSYEACANAVRRAAAGEGPSLVELDVERYLPHTSDDDDTVYRDPAEIEEARKRDPLLKLKALLGGVGMLTDERDAELREAARAEVDAATDEAEAAPFPSDDDVFDHVYE